MLSSSISSGWDICCSSLQPKGTVCQDRQTSHIRVFATENWAHCEVVTLLSVAFWRTAYKWDIWSPECLARISFLLRSGDTSQLPCVLGVWVAAFVVEVCWGLEPVSLANKAIFNAQVLSKTPILCQVLRALHPLGILANHGAKHVLGGQVQRVGLYTVVFLPAWQDWQVKCL